MNKDFLNQLPADEQAVAKKLQSAAETVQVNSWFQKNLETQLKEAHKEKLEPATGWKTKIFPALGWAFLALGAIFLLNWALRSIAPRPLPAANGTPNPSLPAGLTPVPAIEENAPTPTGEPTPVLIGEAYERYGNPLYLAAPLPDTYVEANLYTLVLEEPASIDSARALAVRFGIEGEVYEAPGEIPGTSNFMLTDGRQRMYIRSERYFTYYRDYENYSTTMFSYREPLSDATALDAIDEFLKSHGYDFLYQVDNASQIVNDFYIIPLSPDGHPLRYDYLMPARLELKLDSDGQVIFAQASLVDVQQVGSYGIISAEEAFQKMLAQNGQVGIQEGMRSGGVLKEQFWQRSYPENETITIYGRVTSFPSVETGKAPFISIGDYTVTGNIAGLENAGDMVEASGYFQIENGMHSFVIESWNVSNAMETSIMGTLRKEGKNVILTSFDDNTEYLIEDAPADAPLEVQAPEEQLNVNGVLADGQLVWSSIQYFPAGSGYGGGGGGGSGFYKLNLTGTPVPFLTPAPVEVALSGTGEYIVQEGDTLSKIAYEHGLTIEELMQANGLAEATIFIGQTLVIPGAGEGEPQKIEGLRGILSITIYNKPDGSQRAEYGFINNAGPSYFFLPLEGENLPTLQAYQNRPVDVWGAVELKNGTPTLKVERYEIPFPDLQFQILRGKQQAVSIEEQTATLFTTTNGQTYVQFSPDGLVDGSNVGSANDEVLLEALIIPGETFGGYPALRVFNASMAVNPKNGQPQEMQVAADQPYVIDESQNPEEYTVPVPTIEKVELVYYTSDPRYAVADPGGEPTYIQPVWRFYGHYSNGDEFEILVQALKAEFMLPEFESIEPPG